MDVNDERGIDRRRLLGIGAAGLGAVGAAAAFGAPAAAEGGDAQGGAGDSGGGGLTEIIPAATAGLDYLNVGIFEFDSNASVTRTPNNGSMFLTGSGGFLVASVNLPTGAVVKEVTVWATNTGATPFSVLLRHATLDNTTTTTIATIEVPAGANNSTPLSPAAAVDHAVLANSFYFVESGVAQNVNGIRAMRIGYQQPRKFVSLAPFRAYDSRQAAYAPNNGLLAPNQSRVVSIKDARSTSGAITTADVVPAGAVAVAYNLTIASPTGPNFLAITPGNAASFTASAINFNGTADVANGGIVAIDSSRQVKVWGGDQAGSTHFLVDITGYFI